MKIRIVDVALITALALCASALRAAQPAPNAGTAVEQISVGSGKTRLMDMPVNIERVSIAAPETAEAVPVSARTLMINGRTPGETSLVIWLSDGSRREFDLVVSVNLARVEAATQQLERELGGQARVTVDNGVVYLTGHVRDTFEADRALLIASTLGRVVNLLKVDAPAQERQILLKVRFADVDRAKSQDLGASFLGAVSGGFPFSVSTGSARGGNLGVTGSQAGSNNGTAATSFSLSDALNILLFDSHLNIGATIKALASQNVLQILAEPNLLAINGKEASFVAGGEFPFPNLQGGGGGVGQVTVSFREFGIRLRFLPNITPRGTIRLHVVPEVSSLDFANSLSIQGSTIPALNTRRIETEVELQSGQSFAIAGLLDNRTTDSLSKIPGLSEIPVLGKLFTTRSIAKQNSELLVIVTPEIVTAVPEGQSVPDIPRPQPFIEGPGILNRPPQTPGTDQTGPGPANPVRNEISIQEMQALQQKNGLQNAPAPSQTPTEAPPPLIIDPGAAQPLPGNTGGGSSSGAAKSN